MPDVPNPGGDRPVVIVSNRGPLSFHHGDDGALRARRGAGGLVSGLGPLVADTGTEWIAAALSPGDREAAPNGVIEAEGFRVRTLAIDEDDLRLAYDVVCNRTLWFVHHRLFALAGSPSFGADWNDAWVAYRRCNEAFAEAVVHDAPEGAAVLVQDYHLTLLAPILARARPDLRAVHFSHTPFGGPDDLGVLPGAARHELLAGMAAHRGCGFHSHRWADAFTAAHRASLGTDPLTFVAPLGPDPDDLAATVASPACETALTALVDRVGDRQLVVRVDRIELSKNLVRGFDAFDLMLEQHAGLRGRVVFGAFVYPSREGVAEYVAYRAEVEGAVARINDRWGTPDWTPILYEDTDDYPRSIAALRRADVLLVNPIRDGLNLVAKEGPLVNERDAALVLSPEAGAWDELRSAAIGANPFDLVATADALAGALAMTPDARATHAANVRAVAAARTPADWMADQLAVADRD